MPFKSLVRDLKEKRNGSGSMPRRRGRTEGVIVVRDRGDSLYPCPNRPKLEGRQGRWADLPPELLVDIIRRVEESEISWPARKSVLGCAAACRSWRDIMKEIIRSPEECGRITFPISLKQPAPRDYPIQCFIKREPAKSTFRLYLGPSPSLQGQHDKLLLVARKIRRATNTYFVISLTANDFSLASNTCIGKVRSNFIGNKFTVYDTQPAYDAASLSPGNHSSRRINSNQVSHRTSTSNCAIATISYELNVLPTRGPRRMQCTMHSIPISSIKEGGNVPAPRSSINYIHEKTSRVHAARDKKPVLEFSSNGLHDSYSPVLSVEESLALKNKSPRWHEQLQCWCLNFRGRVTMASVKNFQLVAAVKPSCSISPVEQEKVILQFGKIGKDIFTMDYKYPLSAFQAFSICLTSFDSKRACE